ncbi:MAG TPA: hypothetical protein VJU81_04110 [Methylomirabilota bacterium]|nr:hypothetical protein [Methylomirabilota bacterium]
MQDPTEIRTLSGVMTDLDRRGFTEHFALTGDKLRALISGKTYAAGDLRVREIYRFEGVSNPDDMAILYAIETRGGVRGTLTDAFGVYATPGMGEFMERVPRAA